MHGRTAGGYDQELSEWKLGKLRWTVGLVLVLLLAIYLRWYHFSTFPPGLWFDEAYHLNAAQAIALENTPPQLYYPGKTGEPAIFWLTAVALKLGANHLAPRWVAAIGSLIGMGLLFFASWDVLRHQYPFAKTLALWPTAVLATNYVYLFNSRMGWEPVLVAAVSVPAIWLYWRGLQHGRWHDFFWAGLALGAGQYSGVIARSLPIVLLLITVAWLIPLRNSNHTPTVKNANIVHFFSGKLFWSRFKGMLIAGATAVVVYLPLGIHFYGNPDLFTRRFETAANADKWLGNLGRTLGGFIWLDEQTLHGLANRSVFDWPIAILLIFGAGIALWRWRQPAYSIWLAWLIGFLPGAMMSDPAPVFYRYLPTIPAAAVLSGIALAEAWQWAQQRGRKWRLGMRAAVCLLFAVSLFLNSRDYFRRWASSPNFFGLMDLGKWAAADAILTADGDASLFVTMPANTDPAVSYAIQTRRANVRPFDGQQCIVFRDPDSQPLHFFSITGYEHRSLEQLTTLFPQGSQIIDPVFGDNAPYYVNFVVPAASDAQIPGSLAEPIHYGSIILRGVHMPETAAHPSETLPVTLTWQATAPVLQNLTAFVHLLSQDPGDSSAPLKAQHDGVPCYGNEPTTQWHAGEFIVDEHPITLPPDLRAGHYLLGIGFYQTDTLHPIPPMGENPNILWGEAIVREITVLPGS